VTQPDPDEPARRLAAESLAAGDPTGWFERLYVAAQEGEAVVPWDRGAPHRLLVEWAQARAGDGRGRRALVVGSGLGDDAEHVAGQGFDTVAFDVSPTAIRAARARAIANVAAMVAPGGTLVVIAAARDERDAVSGPPWPLTRAEIDAFATAGLRPVRIELLGGPAEPDERRWRAELERPPARLNTRRRR
jgi:SAM-dependent methyltransferase